MISDACMEFTIICEHISFDLRFYSVKNSCSPFSTTRKELINCKRGVHQFKMMNAREIQNNLQLTKLSQKLTMSFFITVYWKY